MEETKTKEIKKREGGGYLKQLYSSAVSTRASTSPQFTNRTTFMVNFIRVDLIDPSEFQVRSHFDDEEVKALSHSIAEHGVLQPILVVQNGERYKVIAGERRLRAAKMAGLDRIPARVMTADDKGTQEIALRENLDRVDLHPIEEGEAYVSLINTKAYDSHDAIAQAFKKQKSRITECIGYTKLPKETKAKAMEKGIRARSVLRQLLGSPQESHEQIIALSLHGGEAQEDASGSVTLTSVQKTKTLSVQSFECRCDEKGVSLPSFKWKKTESKDRLSAYLKSVEEWTSKVRKQHLS